MSLHIAVSHPAFVSQSFLAQIDQIANKCNYNSFLERQYARQMGQGPERRKGNSKCFVYDNEKIWVVALQVRVVNIS
jgi:hypothetical protein